MQTAADWRTVTDTYEFEDGSKSFNEVADVAPVRWEYSVICNGMTAAAAKNEADVYEDFFNTVRLVTPFDFTDKFGTVWPNVYVESFEKRHDAHKSWTVFVDFVLVSFTGISASDTYDAGDPDDIHIDTVDGGSA